jgi:hypothetical protein
MPCLAAVRTTSVARIVRGHVLCPVLCGPPQLTHLSSVGLTVQSFVGCRSPHLAHLGMRVHKVFVCPYIWQFPQRTGFGINGLTRMRCVPSCTYCGHGVSGLKVNRTVSVGVCPLASFLFRKRLACVTWSCSAFVMSSSVCSIHTPLIRPCAFLTAKTLVENLMGVPSNSAVRLMSLTACSSVHSIRSAPVTACLALIGGCSPHISANHLLSLIWCTAFMCLPEAVM